MIKPPALDKRSRKDIMEELRARAASYTPEWKYDPEEMEAGSALAELFGDMFYGTVDRLSAIPSKYYTEFLNLLGASRREAQAAGGYIRFGCVEGAAAPSEVPMGTAAFAATPNGNVVYETSFGIEATPAKLTGVYYSDPDNDMVSSWPMDGEITFFAPSKEGNVQKHQFFLAGGTALALSAPCEIQLHIYQTARFQQEETAAYMAERQKFAWEYFDGREYRSFDDVKSSGSSIILTKLTYGPIFEDGDGMQIRMRAIAAPKSQVTLKGVRLSSRLLESCPLDSADCGDVPISLEEGGYCFGRRPAEYDVIYFRCDDAFSKRSAHVCLSLDVEEISWTDVDTAAQYVYGKNIIDKRAIEKVELEDIFVQQVVWEYWNGIGWARLKVMECKNPFHCKQNGKRDTLFICPEDMEPTLVNAREGWYIRARVANVENYFSSRGRWLLPFLKGASCNYSYSAPVAANSLMALNNGRTVAVQNALETDDLCMDAIAPMAPGSRAMYLCFDSSPNAMPLSLYLDVVSGSGTGAKLRCEYLSDGGFRPAQLLDRTGNMTAPGTMLIYVPEPTAESELMGKRGHWIRLVSDSVKAERLPVVAGIYTNCVTAVQRRRADDQLFNTGIYEANKQIQLLEAPVLECQVWIDEAGHIAASEMRELETTAPQDIRIEREGTEITHCYVRWKEMASLRFAGSDKRAFELDAQRGVIFFGDGKQGRVPPEGDLNIRISYAACMGEAGNLPAGRVNALVTPVAGITSVNNITPMCGGAREQSMEELMALGRGAMRRRGRAVSERDFEELVTGRFGEIEQVRCFANTDHQGRNSPGCVCLVITPPDQWDRGYTQHICAKVKDYIGGCCDSMLFAGGRLFVVPSVTVSVNVTAVINPVNWNTAAATQREVAAAIDTLIRDVWEKNGIGRQIRTAEVFRAIKGVPGVGAIEEMMIQGEYELDGKKRMVLIDENFTLPFLSMKNGLHAIKVR